jgi:hypothetical protein
MVTELGPAPVAPVEPGADVGSGQSFDQLLVARAKEMFRRDPGSRAVKVAVAEQNNNRFGDILQLSAQAS